MKKTGSNKKIGRPKAIPTPEDFWGRFLEYAASVKTTPLLVQDYVGKDGKVVYREKELPLTMEGFENFLEDHYGIGCVQQYLENRDGRYAEFVSICSRVRREIRADQITGTMAGIYPHNFTARMNGISEKVEQTVKSDVKMLNIDPL